MLIKSKVIVQIMAVKYMSIHFISKYVSKPFIVLRCENLSLNLLWQLIIVTPSTGYNFDQIMTENFATFPKLKVLTY